MEGTGLYAYGFSYYDPVIGRFTGVDPIADQFANQSPYNYVFNNPISLVDPDGRAPAGCCGGGTPPSVHGVVLKCIKI